MWPAIRYSKTRSAFSLPEVWLRLMLLGLACGLLLTMTACVPAVTVRAPILELPPIPARLMEPCEEPAPLRKGTLEEMYVQMLEDAGPWGRCVRAHDRLIEVIKYRDSILQQYKQEAAKPEPGWRWPWMN